MTWLKKTWSIGRWILLALVIGYIALVIYRIPAIAEQEETAAAIARIEAARITLADVMGENLPSTPDSTAADSTIEGIDANKNGIRDDVELAIFAAHPDSARLRAAQLQYAKALQMYLTEVFNSETLVAAIKLEDRGYGCVSNVFRHLKPSGHSVTDQQWNEYFKIADVYREEVKNLILNTNNRESKYSEVFEKYMTSYGLPNVEECDLVLEELPN